MSILVDQRREKTVEAIRYFVTSTKYCGTTKLFKLLYWLDYHHFLETGRDVTGLIYTAYKMGPVPDDLYEQISSQTGDIADQFVIKQNRRVTEEYDAPTIDSEPTGTWPSQGRYMPTEIKSKRPFKHEYLTRRELKIAENLAEIFNEATAQQMSDISHDNEGLWAKAIKANGEYSRIDFLSARSPVFNGEFLSEDEIKEIMEEEAAIERALS